MDSSEPVSKQLKASMPSQAEWRQTLAQLEDIADDLGLPKFGDFTDEDISPDMIKAAVEEQVKNVDERIAVTKSGEPGPIKRWENREKQALPLYFHLPHGKGLIKRLMICGRFTIPEIAQMLGLRERALKDIIKGMGLGEQIVAAERSQKLRKYRELMAEYSTYGRMLATQIAVEQTEMMLTKPGEKPMRVNVKDLVGLNKVLVANDPASIEGGKGTGGPMPTVGIGIKVTHVDKNHRSGTTVEMEGEILPDEDQS